ncbi:MAG TPA: hypothetical protein VGX91_00830 [Candidatus Cybelea sp.]|jgi:hypothetical protein|nr:hypothetical protein [Candidatus Cybelea sp.]
MKTVRFAVLLACVAALLPFLAAQVSADAPPNVTKALTSIRNLPDTQFAQVVRWARNGTPQPSGYGPVEQVQSQILELRYNGQHAIVGWLQTGNRSALYALGATDAQIGSRSPSSVASATPNPYRSLEFGTATLGGKPAGNIEVFAGWAAVKRDSRGAHVCVSFKNVGTIAATRVLFSFPLMNEADEQVAKLELDRRGTFSPGIAIHGWSSLSAWQSGSNRGYDENCTGLALGVAAFPLRSALLASYRILRVEYADGSQWMP